MAPPLLFDDGVRARPLCTALLLVGLLAGLGAPGRAAPRGAAAAPARLRSATAARPRGASLSPLRAPRGFRRERIDDATFARLHPEPAGKGVYHNRLHTENVARFTYQLGRRGGLDAPRATFLAEVALLHDIDPTRQAGKPARVAATIEWLRGREGRALTHRWGWTRGQVKVAEAIIQRTEFPFDRAKGAARPVAVHGGEALAPAARGRVERFYGRRSPVERYRDQLRALPAAERDFVMTWAPMVSEYADKGSYYLSGPRAALAASRGLQAEVPFEVLPGTRSFLGDLGTPASFAPDRAVARELGVAAPRTPGLGEVLSRLGGGRPEAWGRTLKMYERIAAGERPAAALRAASAR